MKLKIKNKINEKIRKKRRKNRFIQNLIGFQCHCR